MPRKTDDPKQLTFIYLIVCPETDVVRYVGRTTNPLSRIQAHCNGSGCMNDDYAAWIKSLRDLELRPKMRLVDSCPFDESLDREHAWINHCCREGAALLNKNSIDRVNPYAALIESLVDVPIPGLSDYENELCQQRSALAKEVAKKATKLKLRLVA